jgi:hypothetical protein
VPGQTGVGEFAVGVDVHGAALGGRTDRPDVGERVLVLVGARHRALDDATHPGGVLIQREHGIAPSAVRNVNMDFPFDLINADEYDRLRALHGPLTGNGRPAARSRAATHHRREPPQIGCDPQTTTAVMTKRAFDTHRTARLNLCMCVATPYAYVLKHDTVIGSTSVRARASLNYVRP